MGRPRKTAEKTVEEVQTKTVVSVEEKNVDQENNQAKAMEDTITKLTAIIANLEKKVADLESGTKKKDKEEVKLKTDDPNRWVKVIHLLDNATGLTTHMEITNRKIDLRKFGDVVRLRLPEFEELLSKYMSWFDQGVIALTSEDDDLARMYNVPCGDNLPLTATILSQIGTMPEEEIKALYDKLGKAQKDLIIRKWMEGYYQLDANGVQVHDSVFRDRRKIVFLNELSGGKLERVLDDLKNEGKR